MYQDAFDCSINIFKRRISPIKFMPSLCTSSSVRYFSICFRIFCFLRHWIPFRLKPFKLISDKNYKSSLRSKKEADFYISCPIFKTRLHSSTH